jgi:hypothetical protein
LKTIPLPGGMSLPCSVEFWGDYYMVCSLGDASDGNSNGAIGIFNSQVGGGFAAATPAPHAATLC